MANSVFVRRDTVVLPTYQPQAPDRSPMFLEKRVYQGSSGCVYPLPYYSRISETPVNRPWEAIFIENEFLSVMILPELGGRIHRAVDKTNNYDLIYYQPVIKPALVGLAGPWISGGIEFNWPQHHRPSTFMPADVHVEEHADGSMTVWLSEHDPMARMKGMHGVCLHPGRSLIELKARAYNRTADVQTFLWWANVATRVHEAYRSFFPPDATYVADHAKRAMSTYPLCRGRYYGVDYGARGQKGIPKNEVPRQFVPPHCGGRGSQVAYRPDDLSWYANIPVPTSYMCMGTREDFFGGYDYKAQAGIIHVANHHISPGKKQWTWGNHEFGYAWDRNLTDADSNGEYGPYIEIMAGVYTDNQPDFSFLMPGETKSWSQFWYPIRSIGSAQHANIDAAVSFEVERGVLRFGVAVTTPCKQAKIVVCRGGKPLAAFTRDLSPAKPFVDTLRVPATKTTALSILVEANGRKLIEYVHREIKPGDVPPAATEPPAPRNVAGSDELYLIGLHLEQYRHATRKPELYWHEALRRDPGDSRCNLALGRWHLRRGEFTDAERFLRASIARLTVRNLNPYDGEPLYQLGICLRHLGRDDEAYDAFYKATWNHAWQAAGYHALAEIDCCRGKWETALDHLDRALKVNSDNLRARDLKSMVLRKLRRNAEVETLLTSTLALDPLDGWARWLRGDKLTCDSKTHLDLALDLSRAGFLREAIELLGAVKPEALSGTEPLLAYHRAWLYRRLGDEVSARHELKKAMKALPHYCFPSRLEDIAVLNYAIATNARDARARYYLGNLFYDRRRHQEAIALWEQVVRLEPSNAVAWRNLGIGCYNILHSPTKARRAYAAARRADPLDARFLFENDQLWKRIGISPRRRLAELEKNPSLVASRDDLAVEICSLYNQVGQPQKALELISTRKFQPWEGGEGQVLGQYVRAHLLLGRVALMRGDAAEAKAHFLSALHIPENLGEARHLLANCSDIYFWLGEACAALAHLKEAKEHWTAAATFKGDFQEMSVRNFSEMTYYSALAWRRLGQKARAERLLKELLAYAKNLYAARATIDYFATSLPTMLLFEDDLKVRQQTTALFLEAQARLGLGQTKAAQKLLRTVLQRDPSHALAADFLNN
ncbi:MAG: DUF5107 domain-containing protein [Nibricoccus sp.]